MTLAPPLHSLAMNNWPFPLKCLLCLLLGGLGPLSFAPYDYWWVILLSLTGFAAMIYQANSAKAYLLLAFSFGLGYFGSGVSWVYVSIHYFGSAPMPLALAMTAMFVSFVALVFALPFYGLGWIKPQHRLLLGIPLLWVFSEWVRTWIFTGFPWLFVGYTQTDGALSGWAPVGGVLLISLFCVFTSCSIAALVLQKASNYRPLVLVLALWAAGYGLQSVQWTNPLEQAEKISVGLVQPNIPQDLRWTPEFQTIIPERLNALSEPLWDKDWVIWPEGAIHNVYHRSLDFLEATKEQAIQTNTRVISGVIYDSPIWVDDRQTYFNSIVSIGADEGIYHKQRLVPFGEYVPLEQWLRGLIDFFDLPLSVISIGPSNQENLQIGDYTLANAICYEIAYPSLVASQLGDAHVLLTVSNDAWFGQSIGPLQHFQMARMRAIEIGRYVIRGTNNGISAIIEPTGKVQTQAQPYVMANLEGVVTPMTGDTPYVVWKNYLVLSLLVILAGLGVETRRRNDL